MIQVFKPGSEVLVGEGKIKAVVCMVTLYNKDRVLYTCGYWNANTYETKQFEEFELVSGESKPSKIGFKS